MILSFIACIIVFFVVLMIHKSAVTSAVNKALMEQFKAAQKKRQKDVDALTTQMKNYEREVGKIADTGSSVESFDELLSEIDESIQSYVESGEPSAYAHADKALDELDIMLGEFHRRNQTA